MSGSVVLCGLGGILLIAAIIGGGFEIKELRIPVLSRTARLFAGLAGTVVLLMGIGLAENEGKLKATDIGPEQAQAQAQAQEQSPIDFVIRDELDQSEDSEQIDVYIDSKKRGTLIADRSHPNAELTVTVPSAGRYSYQMIASGIVPVGGELKQVPGSGEGFVNVVAGSTFNIFCDFAGEKWMLTLGTK